MVPDMASEYKCPHCGSLALRSLELPENTIKCLQCGRLSALDFSRRRILVVEDEWAIALDLANLLRDYGASVVGPANNPTEAIRHVARTRPHGAVLDVKPGSEDCSTVAEILTLYAIPFVFVTAYSTSDVVARYPWMPVLTKPYTPIDVINSLKVVLAA